MRAEVTGQKLVEFYDYYFISDEMDQFIQNAQQEVDYGACNVYVSRHTLLVEVMREGAMIPNGLPPPPSTDSVGAQNSMNFSHSVHGSYCLTPNLSSGD